MAETVKHTPGPWHVGYGMTDIGCTNVKIGGHAKLFDVRGWGYLSGDGHGGLGLPYEEAMAIQKANALLVAAAPDLLEAVQETLRLFRYKTDDASDAADFAADVELKLEAAIAKAEGRS